MARRGDYHPVVRTEIDHLVVACADLDQGEAWLRAKLGVDPQPGGKHLTMGTHNRLLRLGQRIFLELIAIDPDGETPARPRWFDLDRDDVRARAAESPFLITWVARCDDILDAITRVPALGEAVAFTRNQFSWRFALRDDGALNFGGVLPPVIQWDGDAHPADGLEDRGCALTALELSHPAASSVVPLFRELRVTGPVELKAGPRALVARIDTPGGAVALR